MQSGEWSRLFPAADGVYTDPPWTAGMQRLFHRLAGLHPMERPFEDFIRGIAGALKEICPTGIIACEMGKAHYDLLRDTLHASGARSFLEGTVHYGHDQREYRFWIGGFGRPFNLPATRFQDGAILKRFCVETVKQSGPVFCDPFCGRLEFVQEAMRQGMICHGCELIPAKLARGLCDLSRQCSVTRVA